MRPPRPGTRSIVSPEQVRAAVDVIHPSFEIIETRGDLVNQIALALADNGQQRSVVLGAPVQLAPTTELDRVEARVQLNGNEVASGLGSAVLGNPMNSIQWLAEKLGQHGRRLRPGDIIMTGSFVRQFPLQAGISRLRSSPASVAWRWELPRREPGVSSLPLPRLGIDGMFRL